MPASLIPQEIYLIERYSSLEYFAAMRDAWDAMGHHVEPNLTELGACANRCRMVRSNAACRLPPPT